MIGKPGLCSWFTGGLKSKLQDGESAGQVVMKPQGTYGVPPLKQAGSILRRQVCAWAQANMHVGMHVLCLCGPGLCLHFFS